MRYIKTHRILICENKFLLSAEENKVPLKQHPIHGNSACIIHDVLHIHDNLLASKYLKAGINDFLYNLEIFHMRYIKTHRILICENKFLLSAEENKVPLKQHPIHGNSACIIHDVSYIHDNLLASKYLKTGDNNDFSSNVENFPYALFEDSLNPFLQVTHFYFHQNNTPIHGNSAKIMMYYTFMIIHWPQNI